MKTRWSKAFVERYPEKEIYFDEIKETYGERGDITDNPTGNDEVGDKLDELLAAIESGSIPKPATIVVDNMTVLEEYQMNKAMIAGYELAGNKEKTALARLRDQGIIKPGDNDWGAAQSIMNKFMNFMSKLPFHLVVVAHEYKEFASKKSLGEGRGERVLEGVYPLFVGKQRTDMARFFDNVWHTTVSGSGRNQQYIVQTSGDDTIVAGTRVGGLLDQHENDLDLTKVINDLQDYAKTLTIEDKAAVRASVRTVRNGS